MAGLSNKVLTIPPFITNDSMVADGVIVASKISVTYLSDIKADFGTITAGNITGITITGGTITGAVIQTASSGQRIAINQSGNDFVVYDGAGNDVLDIFGSTPGRVMGIQPSSTSTTALVVTMPSGSGNAGVVINNPGSNDALAINVQGSGAGLHLLAYTGDLTNAMLTISDGGFYKNLVELISSYGSTAGQVMLSIQNTGPGSSVIINQQNGSSGANALQITNIGTAPALFVQGTNLSGNYAAFIESASITAPVMSVQGGRQYGSFEALLYLWGATIWCAAGVTPNGVLPGAQGDFCLNGPGGVPYYCTGGSSWTAV